MATSMIADKNCLLPEDLFPFADEDTTQAATNAAKKEAAEWDEAMAKWEAENPPPLVPLITSALINFAKTTLEPYTIDPEKRANDIVDEVMKTHEMETREKQK